MKNDILAVIVGTLCMVAVDLMWARFSNSTIAVPAAVFVGGCVAGLIAGRRGWLIGLMVGCVNSLVTLALYLWLDPGEALRAREYSVTDVLFRPILLSLLFGLLGGLAGGLLGGKRRAPPRE